MRQADWSEDVGPLHSADDSGRGLRSHSGRVVPWDELGLAVHSVMDSPHDLVRRLTTYPSRQRLMQAQRRKVVHTVPLNRSVFLDLACNRW